MKNRMAIILALIIAGVMIAGCTQDPAPAATQVPTPLATSTETTPVPQPSFSLGDHYLKTSYAFQSEKDVVVEQVRVDNPSWGIVFDVLPLKDDTIYTWFEMNVTNTDTGQTNTFGYGRTNGFVLKHLIPMYNTGLYKIEMRGNLVKVDVAVAKRNP